jgi:type II secretory pathway pseudopilin PulG
MQTQLNKSSGQAGFTLAEMVVCFAIVGLVIGGILTAYTNSSNFAERAGYALAAQAQTVQVLERSRAATWDTQLTPIVDQTTNLPATSTAILDLPITGTNAVWCTNYYSVSTITVSANPPCYVKMITVTTVWPWNGVSMTNTMVAYRAPDT